MEPRTSEFRLIAALAVAMWLCTCPRIAARERPSFATQIPEANKKAPVPKGKEPVDIIATVVAMTRQPWENVGYSFHVVLLRVERVLGQEKLREYVRADFEDISTFIDSDDARMYHDLEQSLRKPRTWKIHLRPARGSPECWTLPPPPIPGDIASGENPVLLPVGGASGYPDINSVPCYVFDYRDIEETSPIHGPK